MNAVVPSYPEQPVPPYSLEAEGSVLGGLMLDAQAMDDVAEVLASADFYHRRNQLVYGAMLDLAKKGEPLDAVTLAETLHAEGNLDEIGGLGYLSHMVNNTPSSGNIMTYAKIVHRYSMFREALHTGQEIQRLAFVPNDDNWAEISRLAMSIGAEHESQGLQGSNHLLRTAVDRIEQLFANDGALSGTSTGFTEIDEMTTGMHGGDLIVVAGRPAMGKTTFAMNIAEHVAHVEKKPVAVFSLEMPGDQLIMRSIASMGRIPFQKLRSGQLQDEHWPSITSAINILSNAELSIDDTPALTPQQLAARARRHQRQKGQLGLIVVDYLQLMTCPGNDNRTGEVSEISRSLKALAKELNVPIIALSQLNRGLENRAEKRPMMADLRESGSIEQDADLICFIYRDEVYNPETTWKGTAEIIIGKQRNGPIGKSRLVFLGEQMRFDNYAQDRFSDEGDDFTKPEAPTTGFQRHRY